MLFSTGDTSLFVVFCLVVLSLNHQWLVTPDPNIPSIPTQNALASAHIPVAEPGHFFFSSSNSGCIMRGDINQSMWRNKWRDKKSACFVLESGATNHMRVRTKSWTSLLRRTPACGRERAQKQRQIHSLAGGHHLPRRKHFKLRRIHHGVER